MVDPAFEHCVLPETDRFTDQLQQSAHHGHHALLAHGASMSSQSLYYSGLTPARADHTSVQHFLLHQLTQLTQFHFASDRPMDLPDGAVRAALSPSPQLLGSPLSLAATYLTS